MSSSTFTEIRRLRETGNRMGGRNTASSRIERLKLRTIKTVMETAVKSFDSDSDEDDYLQEKICYFNIPYCPFLNITKIQHRYKDTEIKDISVWYHQLAEVIQSINILLDEYSKGEFQTVAQVFTLGVYEDLSVKLVKLRNLHCEFKDYEKIRKATILALQGLYQSIQQYSEFKNLSNMYDKCRERSSILNDPQKLKDYIESMKKRNVPIFPNTDVEVMAPKIKPEYLEYIKLYGYPAGSIFDMDKLGEIIERLKNPPPKCESSSDEESSVKTDEPSECNDHCSDDEYNTTKCEECS